MEEQNQESAQEGREEPAQEGQEELVESKQEPAQRITTAQLPPEEVVKKKHPGRVEAGRRLAEWNRINRAKKKAAAAAAAAPPEVHANVSEETSSQVTHEIYETNETSQSEGYWIIGVAGLVVSLIGLYTRRRELSLLCSAAASKDCKTAPVEPESPKAKATRFLSME